MSSAVSSERPSQTHWIELSDEYDQLDFGDAVRDGLSREQKSLPSQFFYDAEGSRLFEEICELPEYYLTRAETEILKTSAQEIAAGLPQVRTILELGSGSATKTEYLLRAFGAGERPLCYAPIDVSRTALEASVDRLIVDHPTLELRPALAEYEAGLEAIGQLDLGPKLTLWLGSSIGNLRKASAIDLLARVRAKMHSEDRLLVGIDLRKDRRVLERAYDDAQGLTARFDLNLLRRINRELRGTFDLSLFRHRVHYEESSGSVQSFLESQCAQNIAIRDLHLEVSFAEGERIHTEDSHKYDVAEIENLAECAGLRVTERFYDRAQWFSLNLFAPRADETAASR